MDVSFKDILGCSIKASDKEIGSLDDFLFDDRKLTVRYIVVKSGGLFQKERILVSPNAVREFNVREKTITLKMTADEVQHCPDVDAHPPVFRQMEKKYFDFYDWPYYWDDMGVFGIDPRANLSLKTNKNNDTNDKHLRSARIIKGYTVYESELKMGTADDLIFNNNTWELVQIEIDSNGFLPRGNQRLNANDITAIDWFSRSVEIDLNKGHHSITT